METYSAFYENLQELCFQNGISVTKLCSNLGLSNAISAKWKKGSIPRAKTLYDIAAYFGVSVADLLGEEVSDEPPKTVVQTNISDVKELAEVQIDKQLLAMLQSLPPEKVQRVKDFISGMLA